MLGDVGALPPVHALQPEAPFTGAREGDLVEVVQPTGSTFYLAAGQRAAAPTNPPKSAVREDGVANVARTAPTRELEALEPTRARARRSRRAGLLFQD